MKLKHLKNFAVAVAMMAMTLVQLPAADAQPARIGVLTPGGSYEPVLAGFREGLGKLGLRDGREVGYLVEDSKGDVGSLAARALKLADAKPDVILTVATAPTLAAKRSAPTIPLVFTNIGDPVQAGVVASFASSRNHVTGISSMSSVLSAKRLEILKELAPRTKKTLAIVASKENSALNSISYLIEAGAKSGIQIIRRDVTSKEESDALFREK